ncbi:hypothetical protein [Streptomyces sp. NPDC091215]|uniref:hypothetical protein n=1 Tax=Streptomyces sp. NPDC091215 TaxID=3155192 RepID=UPI0034404048
MSGPGRIVMLGAGAGLLLMAAATAALLVLVAAAVAQAVRSRRESRMLRTTEGRRIQRDARVHVDHFAAHDPEVRAGFARLDAAARSEKKGGRP